MILIKLSFATYKVAYIHVAVCRCNLNEDSNSTKHSESIANQSLETYQSKDLCFAETERKQKAAITKHWQRDDNWEKYAENHN